jgi:hypothetical protein
MIEPNEVVAIEKSSTSALFIMMAIIVGIAKAILNKTLYPKIQFARTYFNQELNKATAELQAKYDTVIMLQPDLLAWFVYDTKSNSFGFYFDGEMQFFCPINNYACLNIKNFETLVSLEIKYFDQDGKLCEYEFYLSNFRQFWVDEVKTKEDLEINQMQLDAKNKAVASEIKQRLDIEKSRI